MLPSETGTTPHACASAPVAFASCPPRAVNSASGVRCSSPTPGLAGLPLLSDTCGILQAAGLAETPAAYPLNPLRTSAMQLVQEYHPALRAHLAGQSRELRGYVKREFEDYGPATQRYRPP
jgi:hypothetical protein